MTYTTGSLVTVRGRDWTVLPSPDPEWLLLSPLGGAEDEYVLVSPRLEKIEPASFPAPDPQRCGDARSCSLLRDAVRLGLRVTTGPFRSFGHIAVDPRPYQLVPLLMAMKQSPVRLLIADDVGIGKTVESLLIARELFDRGEIQRMAVLCPPQLAEQWQHEMEEKFNIEARLVLPSTVSRLERGLGAATSLFEAYPFTIVSLDYIKSERHRRDFLRACPEMVIVDEAHTCASAAGSRSSKQRYELVHSLAEDRSRNMVFVTATPHSGKEDVFRSLLGFLDPSLEDLPEDLSGPEHEPDRSRLAKYFVQRRRGDIRAFMKKETPFPKRYAQDITWTADPAWRSLFDDVLKLARSSVQREGSEWAQRVRWWSALAMLRAVSSSPMAAAETLRNRAAGLDSEASDDSDSMEEFDASQARNLCDLDSSDSEAVSDTLPGANVSKDTEPGDEQHNVFLKLAAKAKQLVGKKDPKLMQCIPHIRKLVSDGYSPVIFCRFIQTAEYVGGVLRDFFPKKEVSVEVVTGQLAPEEREARVLKLKEESKRILVCTDCLSEGINLQESFNAIVHYDLSWNPTRHEQREGRVDRFGQPSPDIRIITWYGTDNPMDGMVLNVLLHKHEAIRKSLGVSVPIPGNAETVLKTLVQGLLLRKHTQKQSKNIQQPQLPGLEEFSGDNAEARIAREWDAVAEKEQKRSHTMFAQQTIKTDEVAKALHEASEAAGDEQVVERFVCKALPQIGAVHIQKSHGGRTVHSFHTDRQTRLSHAGIDLPEQMDAVFTLPKAEGETFLSRTHPLVEQLASYLTELTLDPNGKSPLARCGVMRTHSVTTRTTLLLCRFRFEISTSGSLNHTCLAEECRFVCFTGSPDRAVWLDDAAGKSLLGAEPDENVGAEQARHFVDSVCQGLPALLPHVREVMHDRAEVLLDTHRKARAASKIRGLHYAVAPQGKPDILGIFVYLPTRAR